MQIFSNNNEKNKNFEYLCSSNLKISNIVNKK